MPPFYSPLRYPGGKNKLAKFVKAVIDQNSLRGGVYLEPYAGGAAIALSLLFSEYVEKIHINDIDKAIYSFWYSVVNSKDELCDKIENVDLCVDEWKNQRSIYSSSSDILELGFSAFYLNRVNRSGIITGGLIGGKNQEGEWKMDVRFNRSDLIRRIEKINRYKHRIELSNMDAELFMKEKDSDEIEKSLLFIDPPYYVKGKRALYANYYSDGDHKRVSRVIKALKSRWLLTYDNVEEIRDIYRGESSCEYGISYTVQEKYIGKEILFYSSSVNMPEMELPTTL